MKTLDELDALHAEDAERIREELRTTGRHYTEPHEYLHDAWPAFSARLRAAEAVLRALVACDDAINRGDEPPLSRSELAIAARAALGEP